MNWKSSPIHHMKVHSLDRARSPSHLLVFQVFDFLILVHALCNADLSLENQQLLRSAANPHGSVCRALCFAAVAVRPPFSLGSMIVRIIRLR